MEHKTWNWKWWGHPTSKRWPGPGRWTTGASSRPCGWDREPILIEYVRTNGHVIALGRLRALEVCRIRCCRCRDACNRLTLIWELWNLPLQALLDPIQLNQEKPSQFLVKIAQIWYRPALACVPKSRDNNLVLGYNTDRMSVLYIEYNERHGMLIH